MFKHTEKAVESIMENLTEEQIEQMAMQNRQTVANEQGSGSAIEASADNLLQKIRDMFNDGSIHTVSQAQLIQLCTGMTEKIAGRRVALAASANMRRMSKQQLIDVLSDAIAKAERQLAKQQS